MAPSAAILSRGLSIRCTTPWRPDPVITCPLGVILPGRQNDTGASQGVAGDCLKGDRHGPRGPESRWDGDVAVPAATTVWTFLLNPWRTNTNAGYEKYKPRPTPKTANGGRRQWVCACTYSLIGPYGPCLGVMGTTDAVRCRTLYHSVRKSEGRQGMPAALLRAGLLRPAMTVRSFPALLPESAVLPQAVHPVVHQGAGTTPYSLAVLPVWHKQGGLEEPQPHKGPGTGPTEDASDDCLRVREATGIQKMYQREQTGQAPNRCLSWL